MASLLMEEYKEIQQPVKKLEENNENISDALNQLVEYSNNPNDENMLILQNYVSNIALSKEIQNDDIKQFIHCILKYYNSESVQVKPLLDIFTFILSKQPITCFDFVEAARSILSNIMKTKTIHQNIEISLCNFIRQISKISLDFEDFVPLLEYLTSNQFQVDIMYKLNAICYVNSRISMTPLLIENTKILLSTSFELIMHDEIPLLEKSVAKFIAYNPHALSLLEMDFYSMLFDFYINSTKQLEVLIGFIHPQIDITEFSRHYPNEYSFYRKVSILLASMISFECILYNEDYPRLLELIKFKIIILDNAIEEDELFNISNYIISKYDELSFEDKQKTLEILVYISSIFNNFIANIRDNIQVLISLLENELDDDSVNLYPLVLLANILVHINGSLEEEDHIIGMNFIIQSKIPKILINKIDELEEDDNDYILIDSILNEIYKYEECRSCRHIETIESIY